MFAVGLALFITPQITRIFTRNGEDRRSQRTEVTSLFSVFYSLFSDFWSCVNLMESRGFL